MRPPQPLTVKVTLVAEPGPAVQPAPGPSPCWPGSAGAGLGNLSPSPAAPGWRTLIPQRPLQPPKHGGARGHGSGSQWHPRVLLSPGVWLMDTLVSEHSAARGTAAHQ